MSNQNLSQTNSVSDVSKSNQINTNASTSTSTSGFEQLSSDSETGNNRRQVSNIGSNLRLKLGNYTELLKGMMQQVIDTSGIISTSFDQDELANDLFNDEMLSSQNIIHDNCDSDFSSQNFAVEV